MLQGGLCEQRQGAALPLHTADSSCLHNTEPLAQLFLTGLKPVEEPTLKQISCSGLQHGENPCRSSLQ